jgi:pathogenesis-related protein 1
MKQVLCVLLVLCAPPASAVHSPVAPPVSQSQQEILAAHNAVRSRHSLPPLVWSPRLASVAKRWADHLLSSGQFRHNMDLPYGENLYMIEGGLARGSEVVRQWAAESSNFDRRSNVCRGVCGHYTQIVWRDTQSVGCAAATSGRRQVWVCEYNPPGNIVGERPY